MMKVPFPRGHLKQPSGAVFSDCGLYRLYLWRDLGRPGPHVVICGVNPSTAGAEDNDPTIVKEMGFGERLGWGSLGKINKFSMVATDVKKLRGAADPVGADNNDFIRQAISEADLFIAAWGRLSKLPPELRRRWRTVVAIADELGKPIHCFGTTQDGSPIHPLMLSYDTPIIPWERPR